MEMEDLARLIMVNAVLVYDSCLVGNPCQVVTERYNRISKPNGGDLVVEISSRRKWDTEPLNSIGRLIMVSDEPIKHVEWDEEPKPLETYWYIETLDGRLYQWYDCEFIVVSEKEEWKQKSDAVGAFFTEDEQRTNWVIGAKIRHNLDKQSQLVAVSPSGKEREK